MSRWMLLVFSILAVVLVLQQLCRSRRRRLQLVLTLDPRRFAPTDLLRLSAGHDCAPYGYYGPDWFAGGVFLGAGPWFHGHRGFYGHVMDNRYDPRSSCHGPGVAGTRRNGLQRLPWERGPRWARPRRPGRTRRGRGTRGRIQPRRRRWPWWRASLKKRIAVRHRSPPLAAWGRERFRPA